jgi:hypothetical protein
VKEDGLGVMSQSSHHRLDWSNRISISPISIFLILLNKDALTDLLNTFTFKDRNGIEQDMVSSKVTS